MPAKMVVMSRWSTASFGDAASASALELSLLGEHVHVCRRLSGRLFSLQCGADHVHGFVASRFVSSLVLLAILIGVGWLAFAR